MTGNPQAAQSAAERRALEIDKEAYDKVIASIGKLKDELLTANDLAYAEAQGIITEGEKKSAENFQKYYEEELKTLSATEAKTADTLLKYNVDIQTAIDLAKSESKGVLDQTAKSQLDTLKEYEKQNITLQDTGFTNAVNSLNTGAANAINTYNQANNIIQKDISTAKTESINLTNDQYKQAFNDLVSGADKASGLVGEGYNKAIEDIKAGNTQALSIQEQTYQKSLENIKSGQAKQEDIINLAYNKAIADTKGISLQQQDIIKTNFNQALTALDEGAKAATIALQPYAQTGEAANLRQRYLTGLMTKEEKSAYEEKYGGVEASPLYQYELSQGQASLDKAQKARGLFSSGLAIEQTGKLVNQLSAEDAQRQLTNVQSATQMGLGASTNIANIDQTTGQNKSSVYQNMGTGLSSAIGNGSTAGLMAQQGESLSNITQTAISKINEIQNTYGTNASNLVTSAATQIAQNLAAKGVSQAEIQKAVASALAQLDVNKSTDINGIINQFTTNANAYAYNNAQNVSNTQSNLGQNIATIGTANAQYEGNVLANSAQNQANVQANYGQGQITNIKSASDNSINNLSSTGTNLSNLYGNTGSQLLGIQGQAGNFYTQQPLTSSTNEANLLLAKQNSASGINQTYGAQLIGAQLQRDQLPAQSERVQGNLEAQSIANNNAFWTNLLSLGVQTGAAVLTGGASAAASAASTAEESAKAKKTSGLNLSNTYNPMYFNTGSYY